MVRILGILVGLGFCGVAAWSLLWGVIAYVKEPPQATAEARFHLEPHEPNSRFAFEVTGDALWSMTITATSV